MARPRHSCKAAARRRASAIARSAIQGHKAAAEEARHIYQLLCMFNGFAIPKPFCGPIKANCFGERSA
jgi:hypothetical protein